MNESSTNPHLTRWYNNLEKPLLVIGLILMILVINYQTFFRYIMSGLISFASNLANHSLISTFIDPAYFLAFLKAKIGWAVWSEELARYIFIWISYLAVPIAILNKGLIRVDAFHNWLKPSNQNTLWVTIYLLTLALALTLFWLGFSHLQMQLEFKQTTPSLKLNYAIPYFILPLGFSLIALRTIQCLIEVIRSSRIREIILGSVIAIALVGVAWILQDYFANTATVLFGYFAIFIIIGLPIAFSLGLASLLTIIVSQALPIDYTAQIAFVSIDSFPIMAIPFFIAAGVYMGAGGLSERLLSVADKLVGSLPGGLALASIMTCMFFSAISGSGPATVAAIGAITIPAMAHRGYNIYFAAAIVASAGAIGVIIPPSNPFVVYGVSAQASIGKLFIAGIIPGFLIGFLLMLATYFISKKNGWKGEKTDNSLKFILKAAYDAKWALLVPVIILAGIYGGIMTPTESAAVAALYGIIIGMFVYKELTWTRFWSSTIEAALTSSIIIILMAMATIFGNLMTLEQIPETVAASVLSLTESKAIIILSMLALLLLVGLFMEALAAIVIITPVLLPLATRIGIDPIHFGVMMVTALAIGFITPPVGVNLFVASSISKVKSETVAKAAIPFLLVMILALIIISFVPQISLFLI